MTNEEKVKEFMVGAKQSLPEKPIVCVDQRSSALQKLMFQEMLKYADDLCQTIHDPILRLRVHLNIEEALEFAAAACDNDLVEMADAVADSLYVNYGAALALGLKIQPIFDEVHRTNMAKLNGGGGGKFNRFEKPADWQPPQIAKLIEEQKL